MCEVDACFVSVVHLVGSEVGGEAHLPKSYGVHVIICLLDGGDALDVCLVYHRSECTHGGFDALADVGGLHDVVDVHGAEVAGDVLSDLLDLPCVFIEGRGVVDL